MSNSQKEPQSKIQNQKSKMDAAPKRVVVVDDNKLQARSLALLIDTMGFETRYALTGAEAIKLITECRADVALIDIGLPDMKGYEVARRLRALPELKNLTLIAQTGWGRDEDREQAQLAGFDHHLTKPINHALLESILANREGEEVVSG